MDKELGNGDIEMSATRVSGVESRDFGAETQSETTNAAERGGPGSEEVSMSERQATPQGGHHLFFVTGPKAVAKTKKQERRLKKTE